MKTASLHHSQAPALQQVNVVARDVGPSEHLHRRRDTCRTLLEERRLIGGTLGFDVCPAPVWDILLDLYLAEQEGRSLYLWQSCVAANIALSSAHRKIGEMTAHGLIERTDGGHDRRRIGIRLSRACSRRLDDLMDQLAR